MIQSQRWCLVCEYFTLHGKETPASGVGCILFVLCSIMVLMFIPCVGAFFLILVGPLLLVAWLGISLLNSLLTPWRCQVCGTTGNPAHRPGPLSQPAVPRIDLPPINLALIWSKVRWMPVAFDGTIRTCWSAVETVYDGLPEWARPIAWALGLSTPAGVVAIGIWTVIHL
jgi:hypothetical protein